MAAVWTWRDGSMAIGAPQFSTDSVFQTNGFIVNAPESLQRLILRGSAQGFWYGTATTNPPRPAIPPAVYGSVYIEMTDDTGYDHRIGNWDIPTFVTGYNQAVIDGPSGPMQAAGCQWTCLQTIDIDVRIRKAAPPPPSSGLSVAITLFLTSSRVDDDLQRLDWSGFGRGLAVGFQWLTSQPGP